MTFRLPRLNAADRMVTSEGRPAPFFLRFFNIDWAGAIERQEASQAQILAELQAVQQAQQDEIDRLNRVLAGEESFTGLNVGGTDVKPFLDKTDGEKLTQSDGLADQLVDTARIAPNAVTAFPQEFTATDIPLNGDAEVVLQSVEVAVTDGATLIVQGEADILLTTSSDVQRLYLRLYRDSTLIREVQWRVLERSLDFFLDGTRALRAVDESLTAGTYIYELRAVLANPVATVEEARNRLLMVEEYRR